MTNPFLQKPTGATSNPFLSTQPSQPKLVMGHLEGPTVTPLADTSVGQNLKKVIAGPLQFVGAIVDSVKQRSIEPLKQFETSNFASQSEKVNLLTGEPATPEDIAAGKPIGSRFLQMLTAGFAGHGEGTVAPKLAPHEIAPLADKYIEYYGNTVNTDDARELFPSYQADRTTSADVHENASAVAKAAYQKLLETKQGEGNNTVLFTAGGTGAGKSTAVRSLGNPDDFPIIYDTNMNKAGSAVQKIDQALEHGYNVELNLIHNDIKTSLQNALNRAERMREDLGSGRTVPLEEHINTHVGAPTTYLQLAEKYTPEVYGDRVTFRAIDNSGNVPRPVSNAVDFVKDKVYNETHEQLYQQLKTHIEEAHTNGQISPETRNGFLGSESEPGTGVQRNGAGAPKGGEEIAPTSEQALPSEPQSQIQKTQSDNLPPATPRDPASLDSSLPPESDPVQRLIQALKEAKPVRKEQEKLYSQARAQRAARIASVQSRTSGESGYFSELGQLKGELPKVDYESIRHLFGQKEIDGLFDQIKTHPTLSLFDQITARGGLLKMLRGEVPTTGEIRLLGRVFPKELIDALLAKRPFMTKFYEALVNAMNIPRSIMSSFDLSAPLRQGVFFVGRKEFYKSFAAMFKQFGSEKAFHAVQQEIVSRPTFKLMQESGLALTEMDRYLGEREEAFMSNWAEKIPVIGRAIHASGRAYIGFLNKLRADTFDTMVKQAKNLDIDFKENPKTLTDIAKFINSATGRGSLGAFERAAPLLTNAFFSPRLMASRLNLLNPSYYIKLDPFVRKQALKSLISFGTIATTVLTLAKMGGATVGADPRNADFGKIKAGNTRFDILGGFQQYVRLASQLISGKIISSTSGKVITLGEGYRPLTRQEILIRFFQGKENPIASFVTDWLQGSDVIGNKFNLTNETINRFVPLIAQDLLDAEREWGPTGLLTGIPATFGVGVQTYSTAKPPGNATNPFLK